MVKYLLVAGLLAAAVLAWLVWDATARAYTGKPAGPVFVHIPRGATARRMGQILAAKQIVRSSIAFELLARFSGRRDLKAGEYLFDQPVTAEEALLRLARGDVYRITFTVPEGLTMFQIAERVAAAGFATREEFLEAARDPARIHDLAPQARTLEGFLFPSTYYFPRNTGADEIARAMVNTFRREWKELQRESGDTSAQNTLQAVTLASLVERETPQAEERGVVAGVYSNRLKKGIALQCDPTVLYAMELAGKNDGIIHQSDLHRDSPYNTYRYRGLPPGPIGNPGAASLRAALKPAPVNYLYFVANRQGGHLFSRTLGEHNRNVARYRKMVREQNGGQGGKGTGKRRR